MARTKNFADAIRAKMAADTELAAEIEQEAINAHIAQQVYNLRTAARLTQKELADRIGTQQSVISRIEDADYEGHSLGLLKRIADALGKKLTIEFSDPEVVTVSGSVSITEGIKLDNSTASFATMFAPPVFTNRIATAFVKAEDR